MPTTSQLFNLTPQERNAAINTIAREAYQGGGGKDIAAVTANLLSRRLANYGGNTNLVDIVKQPGQYEANFHLNRDQITNPKLLTEADYKRVSAVFDNPAMIRDAYQKSGGALSFRGVSAYGNRKQGDYVPVEGKSNFYFDPLDKQTYQKGLDVFASVPEDSNKPIINAQQFLDGYKGQTTQQIPSNYTGALTINNYYTGDGTETQQSKTKSMTQNLLNSLVDSQSKGQMADPLTLMMEQVIEGKGKINPLMLYSM
jgi:hypothetical protein